MTFLNRLLQHDAWTNRRLGVRDLPEGDALSRERQATGNPAPEPELDQEQRG